MQESSLLPSTLGAVVVSAAFVVVDGVTVVVLVLVRVLVVMSGALVLKHAPSSYSHAVVHR